MGRSLLQVPGFLVALALLPALQTTLHARITRVSVATDGAEGDKGSGFSGPHAISADGRFVVFRSSASQLVPQAASGNEQIFLRDRHAGTTVWADGGCYAGRGYAISPSGDTVGIDCAGGVTLYDRQSTTIGTTIAASPGVLTALDSATVVTEVPGSWWTNSAGAYHFHDRSTGSVRELSKSNLSRERLARDGRWFLFGWASTYLFDLSTGTVEDLGPWFPCDISSDGRFVLFTYQAGIQPPVEEPGLYLLDRESNTHSLVLPWATILDYGLLAADGRYVILAARLGVLDDIGAAAAEILRLDRTTGHLRRLDIGMAGNPSNQGTYGSIAASDDGNVVVFESTSSNLVPDDTNAVRDVFAWQNSCGDGVLDDDELCDDGNRDGGDACSPDCDESSARITISPKSGAVRVDLTRSAGEAARSHYKGILRRADGQGAEVLSGTVRRRANRRGLVHLTLRLNRAGRRLLASRGTLPVAVEVRSHPRGVVHQFLTRVTFTPAAASR